MQPLDIKAAKAVKANVGKKAGFSGISSDTEVTSKRWV